MKLDDDDFTLLGVPPRFAQDLGQLADAWRALQARVHPDRFAADGPAAQRLALQWAARVNEAYARLKEPLARGAYLAALRGAPVDAERNTAMPPAFLMQQMAWREALDEQTDLAALQAEVALAENARLAALATALDGPAPDAVQAAAEVRALLFIKRFKADVARRLHPE